MAATSPLTADVFETQVLNSSVPVLVDFWAEWCGPCKAIGPSLEALAAEMDGQVKIMKLNVDEEPEFATRFGIMGIPALLLFKEGKEVDRMVGAGPKDAIASFIKRHL